MEINKGLKIERQSSATILKDFHCGIVEMDNFIHQQLDSFLADHRNQLFVVKDEQDCVIGMFVLSEGHFFDDKDKFIDSPAYSKPFAILDRSNGGTKLAKRYSTIEIEYLAVAQSNRNKHLGKFLIQSIRDLAVSQNTHFITVDAYFNLHYSAIPFYEKCGFIHLENQDRGYDTIRMVLDVQQSLQ